MTQWLAEPTRKANDAEATIAINGSKLSCFLFMRASYRFFLA